MPQPLIIPQLEEPLLRAYSLAWRRVIAEEQDLITDPVNGARVRRLQEMRARIEAEMDALDEAAGEWVSANIGQIYGQGAAIGSAAAGGKFDAWTEISKQAVQQIAQDTFTGLLKATKGVRDSTKGLIRSVARDEALQKTIEGKTAEQAGRLMQRRLEKSGIHSVKYANGARHGLAEYSQMALRTKTATAYNTGSLEGAAEQGTLWWECFDGPECGWSYHEDPTLASGKVVTKDEALAFVISHPNCRRSFGARPDIKTKSQAKKEELAGGSVDDASVQAQLEADLGGGPAPRPQRQPRRADGRRATGRETSGEAPGSSRAALQKDSRLTARSQKLRTVTPPADLADDVTRLRGEIEDLKVRLKNAPGGRARAKIKQQIADREGHIEALGSGRAAEIRTEIEDLQGKLKSAPGGRARAKIKGEIAAKEDELSRLTGGGGPTPPKPDLPPPPPKPPRPVSPPPPEPKVKPEPKPGRVITPDDEPGKDPLGLVAEAEFDRSRTARNTVASLRAKLEPELLGGAKPGVTLNKEAQFHYEYVVEAAKRTDLGFYGRWGQKFDINIDGSFKQKVPLTREEVKAFLQDAHDTLEANWDRAIANPRFKADLLERKYRSLSLDLENGIPDNLYTSANVVGDRVINDFLEARVKAIDLESGVLPLAAGDRARAAHMKRIFENGVRGGKARRGGYILTSTNWKNGKKFYESKMSIKALRSYKVPKLKGGAANPLSLTSPEARGFYSPQKNMINVGDNQLSTLVHELGHMFENGIAREQEVSGYAQRGAPNGGLQRMTLHFRQERRGTEDLVGIYGEHSSEVGAKDEWWSHYMGKELGVQADTEIVSMGLEAMAISPAKLYAKDPETFWFIVGVLGGDFV